MCLLSVSYKVNDYYPLIIASNRDEYFQRPTRPVHFWEDEPTILAGRDLKGMGTWMGITKTGRFAALTNYRNPKAIPPVQKESRGHIVKDFLLSDLSTEKYIEVLNLRRHNYEGYNLIFGTLSNLNIYYYSNVTDQSAAMTPGIHGLSNAFLNTPWPKVEQAKRDMGHVKLTSKDEIKNQLFLSLANNEQAPDALLPNTGVGYTLEKQLSSVFIGMPNYGTRASSVILFSKQKDVAFFERTIHADGTMNDKDYSFRLLT